MDRHQIKCLSNKNFLLLIVSLTAAFIMVISSGLPAAAAISGFVARDSNGGYFLYCYDDLLDSLALKLLDRSNGLFEDFNRKKTYAIHVNENGYIDYNDLLDHYARALINEKDFNLSDYLLGSDAKKASMPDIITFVESNSGQLIHTDKKISVINNESGSGNELPESKTPIVGMKLVSLEQAQIWAESRDASQRYINIAPLYWQYGAKFNIRPEVLYAQAAIETNFGNYTGQLIPEYNNWAGIKLADAVGDSLEDFQSFSNPDDGVRAHFNHMAAYVGADPIGELHDRYHVAANQSWSGTVTYVEELSGKWASTVDYHVYLRSLLDQMINITAGNLANDLDADNNEPDGRKSESEGNAVFIEKLDKQIAVNVTILHLRGGPGTEYEILDRLQFGTVLQAVGMKEEWLQVNTSCEKEGWVHSDYVRETFFDKNIFIGKTIVVDPGHGGSDPGATGITGLQEKNVTMAVSEKLAILLKEAGATVIMTRSGDYSASNLQRVELANKADADLFISIHSNAYSNPLSNGIETHYFNGNSNSAASKFLAQHLQQELVFELGLRNRGVKTSSFYILTRVNMPIALVEIGFLTNPNEEALLKETQTHSKAAWSLFRGIESYLKQYQ